VQNEVRIIGGKWRGRKIAFPFTPHLRPTPDRVRETLFNWLAPTIVNARCLDLFAGSGALSFEALSRGAESVMALEKNGAIFNAIQNNIKTLNVEGLTLLKMDALSYLKQTPIPFDIIFLDPPYSSDLLSQCLLLLSVKDWLKKDGLIYFESNNKTPLELPPSLTLLKEKKAGSVYYFLATSKRI